MLRRYRKSIFCRAVALFVGVCLVQSGVVYPQLNPEKLAPKSLWAGDEEGEEPVVLSIVEQIQRDAEKSGMPITLDKLYALLTGPESKMSPTLVAMGMRVVRENNLVRMEGRHVSVEFTDRGQKAAEPNAAIVIAKSNIGVAVIRKKMSRALTPAVEPETTASWGTLAGYFATIMLSLLTLAQFGAQTVLVGPMSPGTLYTMVRGGAMTLMPPDLFVLGILCAIALYVSFRVSLYLADVLGAGVHILLDSARYPELSGELCMVGIFGILGGMMGFSFVMLLAHSLQIAAGGALFASALSSMYVGRGLAERGRRSSLYAFALDAVDGLTIRWENLCDRFELPLRDFPEWLVQKNRDMVMQAFQMSINEKTFSTYGCREGVCQMGRTQYFVDDADQIKEAVLLSQGGIRVYLGKATFVVHPKMKDLLGLKDNVALAQFLRDVITERGGHFGKGLKDFEGRTVTIACYDRSHKLVGDHSQNDIIGVNMAFSEIPDRNAARILLEGAIGHDLLHETGIEDEESLTGDDVRYTMERLRKEEHNNPAVYAQYFSGLLTIASVTSLYPLKLLEAFAEERLEVLEKRERLDRLESLRLGIIEGLTALEISDTPGDWLEMRVCVMTKLLEGALGRRTIEPAGQRRCDYAL